MQNICGLLISVVLLVTVQQNFGQDQYYGQPEDECLRNGGMCIIKTQCSTSPTQLGLCPKQQSAGFECCHGLPKDEKRCQKHGGHCVAKTTCSQRIVYNEAIDCSNGQECCILV